MSLKEKDWRSRPRKPRPDVGQRMRLIHTRHGMAGTPTYKTWVGMMSRCHNENDPDYANYGARGITVSDEWRADFVNFLRDMGERPAGLTLGRIDNNAGYCGSNCRWETMEQQQNNRRSSRVIEAFGQAKTIAQWARDLGVSRQAIRYRIEAGWPADLAVSDAKDQFRKRV